MILLNTPVLKKYGGDKGASYLGGPGFDSRTEGLLLQQRIFLVVLPHSQRKSLQYLLDRGWLDNMQINVYW